MIKTTLIVMLLLTSVAEAKDLYVNNSGSPACSDSTTYVNNNASNPWCTIGRAAWGNATRPTSWPGSYQAQAADSGDIVYITAGTYHYYGSFSPSNRWEPLYRLVNANDATDWITFTTIGGNVALTSNKAGGEEHSIVGTGAEPTRDRYVKWTGGNHWFTVYIPNMAFQAGSGVITIRGDYTWIEKWDIAGVDTTVTPGDQHVAILAQGSDSNCLATLSNLTIRNNKLHGFGGVGRNSAGITMYCLGDNILIEYNNIYDNWTGINGKSSYLNSDNVNIRKNNIYANHGDGIAMQAFDSWYVYQNILRDNEWSGFRFFCDVHYQGSAKPTDIKIVNNTMYGNYTGIAFNSLCENMDSNYVRNNIITNSTNSVLYSTSAECTTTANMGTDDVSFNYNLYEYPGTFWRSDVGFSSTFANFQSTYGQDANSLNNVDPLYVNEVSKNFRLQATSPARNAGIDILDLDGDGSTTDAITMGAYITGNEIIGIEMSVPILDKIP